MKMRKWFSLLLALVLALSVLPMTAQAALTVDSGSHVRWIDRLGALPDYAQRLYEWMERNVGADGALVDPSKGTLMPDKDGDGYGDGYKHVIQVFTGSFDFTFNSVSEIAGIVKAKAAEITNAQARTAWDYAHAVYRCFDYDHPEVFWLNGQSSCGGSYTYEYTYYASTGKGTATYKQEVFLYLWRPDYDVRADGYRNVNTIRNLSAQLEAKVNAIVQGCEGMTVYQKVDYLNDYLARTNSYNSHVYLGNSDYAPDDAWNCVSALSGRTGANGPVCEGYARAFKVLCDRLGIPCVLEEGYSLSSGDSIPGRHIWNYVKMDDGNWYAVDVTWNDPVVQDNMDVAVSGYESDKWLLRGTQNTLEDGRTFAQSHIPDNLVMDLWLTNGPERAAGDYNAQMAVAENYYNVVNYRSGDTYEAPQKYGYVFAGWYTDPGLTRPLPQNQKTGYAYARFVDADVLSVKWQVTAGTTAATPETTLRLVTTVDSLGYSRVGFRFRIGEIGKLNTRFSSTVYSQIKSSTAGVVFNYKPTVFHDTSRYFLTRTVSGVPSGTYDTPWIVTPVWVTLDGTEVPGVVRTIVISDFYS